MRFLFSFSSMAKDVRGLSDIRGGVMAEERYVVAIGADNAGVEMKNASRSNSKPIPALT